MEEKYQKKISKDFKESINALHKYFANAWDTKFLQYLNDKLKHELKYVLEAHQESIDYGYDYQNDCIDPYYKQKKKEENGMIDVIDYVEKESSQAKGVKDESK